MDKYSYANQQFNPTLFAIEEHIDLDKVDVYKRQALYLLIPTEKDS